MKQVCTEQMQDTCGWEQLQLLQLWEEFVAQKLLGCRNASREQPCKSAGQELQITLKPGATGQVLQDSYRIVRPRVLKAGSRAYKDECPFAAVLASIMSTQYQLQSFWRRKPLTVKMSSVDQPKDKPACCDISLIDVGRPQSLGAVPPVGLKSFPPS